MLVDMGHFFWSAYMYGFGVYWEVSKVVGGVWPVLLDV